MKMRTFYRKCERCNGRLSVMPDCPVCGGIGIVWRPPSNEEMAEAKKDYLEHRCEWVSKDYKSHKPSFSGGDEIIGNNMNRSLGQRLREGFALSHEGCKWER